MLERIVIDCLGADPARELLDALDKRMRSA
jgi:hypothetical protein